MYALRTWQLALEVAQHFQRKFYLIVGDNLRSTRQFGLTRLGHRVVTVSFLQRLASGLIIVPWRAIPPPHPHPEASILLEGKNNSLLAPLAIIKSSNI